jgi:serpin B
MTEQPVRVAVPRFQAGSRFDLARTLQAMGMTDAFQGGRADFSGMSGTRDLFLSMVIHQAEIEVDEEGTEAAAGTVVTMKRGTPPPRITADRPFLYLIRDRQSGCILFLGRVVDPAS